LKIAIISDTHAGIRNASDIFTDNAEEFYSKVFFPYCEANGINDIIHLGDYYDNRKQIPIKAINRNRKMFLAPLRDRGMHMDIIPGNHDVAFKNTNELNSLKELLGHYMNEICIIMNPRVLEYGGMKIGMLPWINSSNFEESMSFIQTCKADVLFGHLELNGFDLMRGVPSIHGLNHKLFSRFELVLTGHFHTRSQKDNVRYLGSQLEFTWADAHDDKFFHVLDTNTRQIEAIRNPLTLFEKIVYDDTNFDYLTYDFTKLDNKFVKVVVVNKSDLFTFDRFIDKIQDRPIHELKIAENFSEFLGENVSHEEISMEDTTTLLNTYIDAVDTDLDKKRIKYQMHSLFVEAQSLEVV